ncbi:adenylate/guanylate cyclase domain-containing protein [Nesterenkonia natronophila]|uniref:Adenylate/guanylate cyclase domain-containing protein n=1 Tax=Nesterenkonia natronophila TaxID=2174932 RepID=A0A3A4F0Z9_9MICC|nr:adenylate/guanylate cyclase domain-containing protein [Nesterenkonia natronophila]RJN31753.1 adenylate/guanylate cyclase domain-containing protein [Nesterenkonia natronophila]
MADAGERARQREFGANRYTDDETAEVSGGANEAGYTAEELAAARADWSDFNLQRPGPPREADSRPRQVPDRGFGPESYSSEPADQDAQQTHAAGAGATAPIPTPSLEERAWHRNIRELEHRLLGAERSLTYRQMAQRMGVSTRSARKLWRALGFPNLDEDVKAFTEADADALAQMVKLVRQGLLNEETAISLTRSIGQMTDRMVVWQIEALVEDKIANQEFSDAEARSHVFDTLPELIDPLHQLLGYAWRRQLSAALQRLTVRVESGLASLDRGRESSDVDPSRDDAPLPLARAVGFADLVSYTSLSRQMSERTLAHMVQRFESKCAELISIGGGRLVKTVGDEVLFNAETPEAGAEIALALSESIAGDDVLPEARVSVVWGRVLSRMGDIYGPTVNLAARLTSLADPGTILVDSSTAEALEVSQDYLLVPQPPRIVRGFGEVSPSLLLRARAGGIALDNA